VRNSSNFAAASNSFSFSLVVEFFEQFESIKMLSEITKK
jgi:hypothetical protein